MNLQQQKQRGGIFIFLIIIIFVFVMIMIPIVANVIGKMNLLRLTIAREQAFQIAEAGRNYYEWHFQKYPNDYADGTGITTVAGQTYGPFTHNYVDYDTQKIIGSFDLYITVPLAGLEIKTIKSIGKITAYPTMTRTVEAKYQKDNVAQYAVFTNNAGYIFTDINGKFYSTNGIRDIMPTATDQIISEKYNSNLTYSCPIENLSPCVATKSGIWSDICPAGQTCCNQASQCVVNGGGKPCDTANNGSDCPNSSVDARSWWTKKDPSTNISSWTSIISDSLFGTMKAYAQSNNVKGYISQTSGIILGASSNVGASLVFNGSGSYDVYRVSALGTSHPSTYWDGTLLSPTNHTDITDYGTRVQINCTGSGCIGNSYLIPTNGVIYVENGFNNLWVEGTVNGRVTVVTATLPYNSGYYAPSIFIPNNIVYDSSCNGNCAIGLISQNYILISYGAPADIIVDGALITQNKSIGRLNYPDDVDKGTLTTFGAFMSNGKSYFGYSSPTRGYNTWKFNYDSNFINSPPPYFPPKSPKYNLIYWKSD